MITKDIADRITNFSIDTKFEIVVVQLQIDRILFLYQYLDLFILGAFGLVSLAMTVASIF